MVIFISLLVFCGLALVFGFIQYFRTPRPPDKLTMREYYSYYRNNEWLYDDCSGTDDESENPQLQERIMLLDETIVKYNKLLDNLHEQYNFTSDEKKRAVILSKQIITLEKLNKALEKREKLG